MSLPSPAALDGSTTASISLSSTSLFLSFPARYPSSAPSLNLFTVLRLLVHLSRLALVIHSLLRSVAVRIPYQLHRSLLFLSFPPSSILFFQSDSTGLQPLNTPSPPASSFLSRSSHTTHDARAAPFTPCTSSSSPSASEGEIFNWSFQLLSCLGGNVITDRRLRVGRALVGMIAEELPRCIHQSASARRTSICHLTMPALSSSSSPVHQSS